MRNTNLTDCFTSVSNGKSSIAAAITDKEIQTAANATFSIMALNIRSIPKFKQYVNETFYPQGWDFIKADGTKTNPGAISLNVGFVPVMALCVKKSNYNYVGFARNWDCFTAGPSGITRYKVDGGKTNVLLKDDGTIAFPVPYWDSGNPYTVVIVGYKK